MCVCLCVCLSTRISPEQHARFFLSIFVHVAYGCGSVLLWQGDEVPRGRSNFGVFLPIDNALYSIAFGTHIKTAEPIEMPFGMMSGLGPTNSVLRGGNDLRRRRGNFERKHVPDKSNISNNIADWTGPRSDVSSVSTLLL